MPVTVDSEPIPKAGGSMKTPGHAPTWVWAFYVMAAVAFYIPLIGVFIGAITVKQGDTWVFTWQWFNAVFSDVGLIRSLVNSMLIGFSASLISTCIGTFAAIGIAKSNHWDRKLLENLSYLVLPEIVMALSLLSWFFILKLQLGLMSVIIAHVTFTLSYVILTVSSRLSLMDPALEDAARDLGAQPWQSLAYITIPLLKPAVLSSLILSFLISFDDFVITFFVNGVGQDTLPVTLYSAMKLGLSPKLNALSMIMLMVTLVFIVFFFRNFGFHALLKKNEK
jgi:spermidine/putrescine transport system permease protein